MSTQAFSAKGSKLELGDGGSPENFTAIAELATINRSGSKSDLDDVTNHDSVGGYREYITTLLDAGDVVCDGNYIPNDTTVEALQTQFDDQKLSHWQIVLPAAPDRGYVYSEGNWAFSAYVVENNFDLKHDKAAKMSAKLKITGKPVFTTGS
jgi:predicted secreted protein